MKMRTQIAIVSILLMKTASASASGLTLGQLNQELESSKATWQATLPSEQVERSAALIAGTEALDGEESSPLTRATIKSTLPAEWDWRNANGANFMTSLNEEQGECGACVAFATVSTLEAQLAVACGNAEEPINLSRQFVFSCGGGNCRGGLRLSDAIQFITQRGVPDAPCFPYQSGSGENPSCEMACSDAKDRVIDGVGFEQPTKGFIDVDAIKEGLLRGPLVANMILFEDLKFYSSGVYRHASGAQLGSHAIVLVGWSDQDRAWIARNSWGDAWGDGGYFKVAWDDASLPGRYTWLFDLSDAVRNGACTKHR